MEATSIPYLKNWLLDKRSLADRVEDGKVIESLTQHPGWALLLERAQVLIDRGDIRLQKKAHETALSADLQARIDYARELGVQSGLTLLPDVAETLLASAKTAVAELKRDATAERAVAGGQ